MKTGCLYAIATMPLAIDFLIRGASDAYTNQGISASSVTYGVFILGAASAISAAAFPLLRKQKLVLIDQQHELLKKENPQSLEEHNTLADLVRTLHEKRVETVAMRTHEFVQKQVGSLIPFIASSYAAGHLVYILSSRIQR